MFFTKEKEKNFKAPNRILFEKTKRVIKELTIFPSFKAKVQAN